MASLDATSCRPEPQERFPSIFSVLGTAVLRHFHYIHRAIPFEILACISSQDPPRPSSTLPPPLSPSLFRRCNETTIYLRTISNRLAILPNYGSQQSQQERVEG
ncbi:hypothetical protein DPMN_052965 [Dreissena polymorpha]|uniref:Uncharacterized protein n=1 Tax=Dreissena polymorpha TaxID=45954 RepID=A0A9D4CMP3_DREPO|nr:hypothetical protein DPMN_052965 [Dreissena polymorpha]